VEMRRDKSGGRRPEKSRASRRQRRPRLGLASRRPGGVGAPPIVLRGDARSSLRGLARGSVAEDGAFNPRGTAPETDGDERRSAMRGPTREKPLEGAPRGATHSANGMRALTNRLRRSACLPSLRAARAIVKTPAKIRGPGMKTRARSSCCLSPRLTLRRLRTRHLVVPTIRQVASRPDGAQRVASRPNGAQRNPGLLPASRFASCRLQLHNMQATA
jgi:hypothetical protein